MHYGVFVFNREKICRLNRIRILSRIQGSNFQTLCDQYGLDPELIAPVMEHLDLILPPEDRLPFFLLKYQSVGLSPLIVCRWDIECENGRQFLEVALSDESGGRIKNHLLQTKEVLVIELERSQLADLGLLLAYELARWAADQGQGIIRGLDGNWYRLNRHKAFVPIFER